MDAVVALLDCPCQSVSDSSPPSHLSLPDLLVALRDARIYFEALMIRRAKAGLASHDLKRHHAALCEALLLLEPTTFSPDNARSNSATTTPGHPDNS